MMYHCVFIWASDSKYISGDDRRISIIQDTLFHWDMFICVYLGFQYGLSPGVILFPRIVYIEKPCDCLMTEYHLRGETLHDWRSVFTRLSF